MSLDDVIAKYKAYFNDKIKIHGATPQGVDYNGPEAQHVRFEQLIKVIDESEPFSVIDYGCGYGALFDFLDARGLQFDYYGFDILDLMVEAGREAHRDHDNARFTSDPAELPTVDYVLAASIFNNKFEADADEWQKVVQETLKRMNALCRKGFSFDVLTSYSDADRMAQRPDLYFADSLALFDFCKRSFSRNVALLHDYGLYDFTIIVRKDV